ncbi:maleylpyruvate isomerase family mycothiol-dependent enzyme [Glycomyces sp. NPDC047369]
MTAPLDVAWLGDPIDARLLFVPEHGKLMSLLRGLAADEWAAEAVPGWSVRDLASHVLADCYGRLKSRDGHEGGPRFAAGETLEAFIHRINGEWVAAFARVSPAALTDTLGLIGAQTAAYFAATDLDGPALGVSWAGADPAPRWLDTARELTEMWTHRQQIRTAAGLETDTDPRFLSVVLDAFMRALPHTMRNTKAPNGTQVRIGVPGPAGGTWNVTATGERWSLAEPAAERPAAAVELDAETAWRLCTRGIEPEAALARARTEGDAGLAAAACRIVSIVY